MAKLKATIYSINYGVEVDEDITLYMVRNVQGKWLVQEEHVICEQE